MVWGSKSNQSTYWLLFIYFCGYYIAWEDRHRLANQRFRPVLSTTVSVQTNPVQIQPKTCLCGHQQPTTKPNQTRSQTKCKPNVQIPKGSTHPSFQEPSTRTTNPCHTHEKQKWKRKSLQIKQQFVIPDPSNQRTIQLPPTQQQTKMPDDCFCLPPGPHPKPRALLAGRVIPKPPHVSTPLSFWIVLVH